MFLHLEVEFQALVPVRLRMRIPPLNLCLLGYEFYLLSSLVHDRVRR
jgi:hypothetical protein